MSKPKKPSRISQKDWDDVDSPPMTKAALARMIPLRDVFPDLAAHSAIRRAKKGEEHKIPINLRLSPEVVHHFRATGKGWQTRLDNMLCAIVATTGESASMTR